MSRETIYFLAIVTFCYIMDVTVRYLFKEKDMKLNRQIVKDQKDYRSHL